MIVVGVVGQGMIYAGVIGFVIALLLIFFGWLLQ